MDFYEIWLDTSDDATRMFEIAGVQGLEKAKETARNIADLLEGMEEAGAKVNVRRVCVNVPARGTVYEIKSGERA